MDYASLGGGHVFPGCDDENFPSTCRRVRERERGRVGEAGRNVETQNKCPETQKIPS